MYNINFGRGEMATEEGETADGRGGTRRNANKPVGRVRLSPFSCSENSALRRKKSFVGALLTFSTLSMTVGKTLNMATLSGGSHIQVWPTLALSYPPYELQIIKEPATVLHGVNTQMGRFIIRAVEENARCDFWPGTDAQLLDLFSNTIRNFTVKDQI